MLSRAKLPSSEFGRVEGICELRIFQLFHTYENYLLRLKVCLDLNLSRLL